MAKYQIWNRTDTIITPSGAVFTPEQWIAKHPIAGIETIKTVISGGTINGALLYEFTGFVERMEKQGCDFSECTTDEEYLSAIEAFEEAQAIAAAEAAAAEAEAEAAAAAENAENQARIAAALEAQVLMSLPDEETETVQSIGGYWYEL